MLEESEKQLRSEKLAKDYITNDIAEKFIKEMGEVMLKHYINYSNGVKTEGLDDCICQDSRNKLPEYRNFIEKQDLICYHVDVALEALKKLWSEEPSLTEYLGELVKLEVESAVESEVEPEEANKEANKEATYQFRSNLAMRLSEYLNDSTMRDIVGKSLFFKVAEGKDRDAYESSLKEDEKEEKGYDTLDENDKILGAIVNSDPGYTFKEDFQHADFDFGYFKEMDNFIIGKI